MESWVEDVADWGEEGVLVPDERTRREGDEHEIVGFEEEGDGADGTDRPSEVFGFLRKCWEIGKDDFLVVLVDNHGFGKQEERTNDADTCKSCLQPKDGAPAGISDNDTAEKWSETWSNEGTGIEPGKRRSSLGRMEEVANDRRSDDQESCGGDGGDHPEDEEGGDVGS